MTTTLVFNLSTRQEAVYFLAPEAAVRNAFAQLTRGDYNTWSYGDKYPVIHGQRTVSCGDWCAIQA